MISKLHFLLLFLITGCGYFSDKPNPVPPISDRVTDSQKIQLLELKDSISVWAPTCGNGIACGQRSDGRLDDGDSMLWAGLLCASGEDVQCNAAMASQQPSGQLCRNPDCDSTSNSFSRDMLLGYLVALTVTKNTQSANQTLTYILDNGYLMCQDAVDNRCSLKRPQYNTSWATIGSVWSSIGLPETKDMKDSAAQLDSLIVHLKTLFSAEGYPRHLNAVELLIRQQTNSWTGALQQAADQLLALQPDNPFFEYVAKGATSHAADQTLLKCPRDKPEDAHQWAWQRDESEQAWKNSKGWDCILMINLLTK